MISLEELMAAKSARDTVRAQIVKELRSLPDPTPEIAALLRADELASADLSVALMLFPIPDSLNAAQTEGAQS